MARTLRRLRTQQAFEHRRKREDECVASDAGRTQAASSHRSSGCATSLSLAAGTRACVPSPVASLGLAARPPVQLTPDVKLCG